MSLFMFKPAGGRMCRSMCRLESGGKNLFICMLGGETTGWLIHLVGLVWSTSTNGEEGCDWSTGRLVLGLSLCRRVAEAKGCSICWLVGELFMLLVWKLGDACCLFMGTLNWPAFT